MEKLLNLFFSSGLGLSVFSSGLLGVDRKLAKSDALALLVLLRRPGASMSELAGDLGAPLSTVTGIVQRLVRRGYVLKEVSAYDRRSYVLTLTDKGRETALALQQEIGQLFERIQAILSPEELQLFANLVEKIFTGLRSRSTEDNRHQAKQLRSIPIKE